MTEQLAAHLKNGWAAYSALVVMIGASVAFATLPARVVALERWRESEQEPFTRYVACVLLYQSDQPDAAAACATHLDRSALESLRPR